jgi:hypothetical protein
MQPMAAQVEGHPRHDFFGVAAPTDPMRGFKQNITLARSSQRFGGSKPGGARTDNSDVYL